jgi:chitinase
MNRKLLYFLVILLIFIGGFLAGITFSNEKMLTETEKTKSTEATPKSAKKPETKQNPVISSTQSKVLIGYVQDFRNPETIDLSNLTHIIFSFAHPTKDGGLLLNGDTALANLRATVEMAHAQNKKVMIAIGGWYHINGGESYDYFKTAIANTASRSKLVSELTRMVEQENLDGIDIDFEHPRSETDAQNLTSFTKELSSKLHSKNKDLSIAVNAKVHSVAGTEIHNVVYDPTMFQYVDHVNIMAYDGQWDGGYNAANLSPYTFTENIVNYWSDLFEEHQLSKEKLVLGVPFYAQPEDPSIKQVSYATIINNNPENATRDTTEMNGTTYHYNGNTTMQIKTNLALEHGFGGMMLWEAGHDAEGLYSLTATISEMLQDKDKETLTVHTSQ